MKRSFTTAALFTAAIAAGLWLFLHLLWSPVSWPAPERRPLQGEAADPARPAPGEVRHSLIALRRVVREPQNAWSNLAYVLAGAWIAAHFRTRLVRGTALAMIGVGIGSFLYHASASGALRAVDVGAMYWLYGHFALLAVASLSPRFAAWCEHWMPLLTAGLFLASVPITLRRGMNLWGVKPFDIGLVTAVAATLLAVALLVHAIRIRRWAAWLCPLGSALLFALAAAFQIGDRPGGWCWNPRTALQGHALWHLLSAAAGALAVWGLARSESSPTHLDNAPPHRPDASPAHRSP